MDKKGRITVRRAGQYTLADVREALFGAEKPKPSADVKEGIRQHIRKKHGNRSFAKRGGSERKG